MVFGTSAIETYMKIGFYAPSGNYIVTPHAFALIDTVYRDLTGLLVHTLCTLPTP
jgi:hypothetical protein